MGHILVNEALPSQRSITYLVTTPCNPQVSSTCLLPQDFPESCVAHALEKGAQSHVRGCVPAVLYHWLSSYILRSRITASANIDIQDVHHSDARRQGTVTEARGYASSGVVPPRPVHALMRGTLVVFVQGKLNHWIVR